MRSPEQVSGVLDGCVVLLSVESGEYYNMNPEGSRIWELLQTPVRVGVLVERLVEEFAVEPATCEAQTLHFLEGLRAAGLLREEGQPTE